MTSRKKTILWIIAIILVAVIGYAVYYFTSIYNGLQGLQKTKRSLPF